MENKKPWQSKTMLLNAVAGLVGAVALFVPGASVVTEFLAAHAAELTMVWGILNMIVRTVTKDKIALVD